MIMNPKTFRRAYEDVGLEEIIKERDNLIREIRRYEKGKIPADEYRTHPSPDIVYMCNQ